MGLLDEIGQHATRKGPPCRAGVIEGGLNDQDGDDLRKAFADEAITATAICAALKARGLDVNDYTLRKHRKGACACGKP